MTEQLERWQVIDHNFTSRLTSNDLADLNVTQLEDISSVISKTDFLELLKLQFYTRHIDLQARVLKHKNLGFYSIASAGHENNIALAYATQIKDVALLHYRSSAFMLGRATQLGKHAMRAQILDQLRSIFASKQDPIAGGRHKVFGSIELNVPPQTSTIASQLPKALGLALSISRNKLLKNPNNPPIESDSIVLCSFGDASFNHSTAQGALNAAKILTYENYPLPLIYVCEDNNIGVSVKTPSNWIASNFTSSHLNYVAANGLDLLDTIVQAKKAVLLARTEKKPVFFHLKTVRLMGHAGSDIEQNYLTLNEIIDNERQDPLLHSAKIALTYNLMSAEEISTLYEKCRDEIQQYTQQVINEPKLESSAEVMASIIPQPKKIQAPQPIDDDTRNKIFSAIMPTWRQPRNLAQAINLCLAEILQQYPNTIIYGEDVGKNGGVYRVTSNLQSFFGRKRVFDSILDEQTILGTAIGYGQNNILPIVEIQFLAYLHNAIDQLRGEAATLPFFSNGKLANPMIIRIPGLAYQKGFGGHFHNDNSLAAIREIPGIIIASPATAADAVKIYRNLIKQSFINNRVCVVIEPIALYFTKNMYTENDGLMLADYNALSGTLELGQISTELFSPKQSNAKTKTKHKLILISYANGYLLSRQAAKFVTKQSHDLEIEVININWLKPLPIDAICGFLKQLHASTKVANINILIVDECRKTGSLSEELLSEIYDFLREQNLLLLFKLHRITGHDSFIPLGSAANHVLPSKDEIINKINKILRKAHV